MNIQDTVVAIKALTRVANLTFSQNLSLNVVVDLPGDEASHRHQLTHNNRYTKQTYEVHVNICNYVYQLIIKLHI